MAIQISSGAEAIIYKDASVILKDRIEKTYRLTQIDTKLRRMRTRRESKILSRLSELNFPAPRLINSCDKKMIIEMEYLTGGRIRDVVNKDNCIELSKEIGRKVALLHNNEIIHGDLTTSNMMMNDEIYFIDFGLSFFSSKIEDKAVDLHLLRQAFESKHYDIWKPCFDAVLEGYSENSDNTKDIFDRLEKVESRGRNKNK